MTYDTNEFQQRYVLVHFLIKHKQIWFSIHCSPYVPYILYGLFHAILPVDTNRFDHFTFYCVCMCAILANVDFMLLIGFFSILIPQSVVAFWIIAQIIPHTLVLHYMGMLLHLFTHLSHTSWCWLLHFIV